MTEGCQAKVIMPSAKRHTPQKAPNILQQHFNESMIENENKNDTQFIILFARTFKFFKKMIAHPTHRRILEKIFLGRDRVRHHRRLPTTKKRMNVLYDANFVKIYEENALMITTKEMLSHAAAQAPHFPKLLRTELLMVIFVKLLVLTVLWYVCFSTPSISSHHHNNIISQHLLEN
jgi:hypothetical protein